MEKLLEKHIFTKGTASLPYRLLKPDGYAEEGTNRYPLVIFLHGIGERGTDNQRQLRNGVKEFVKDSPERSTRASSSFRNARPTTCGARSPRKAPGGIYRLPRARPNRRRWCSN